MSIPVVTIYSRATCHLCDVALETLTSLQSQYEFSIEKIYIDGDADLTARYGEQVPVILINGKNHDFFRVDPERFTAAITQL
jgi:glutaredoxin